MRLKRESGEPPPWTEDPILAGFRFTNIHREDDKVSRQLVEAMDMDAPIGTILFNAFVFRTFNSKAGFHYCGGFHYLWHHGIAEKRLDQAYASGASLFGSAYLMTNSMTGGAPKHRFYLKVFDQVWEMRNNLYNQLQKDHTLETATKVFTQLPGYAEFLGYEMALDMEMLGLLVEPPDKFTWANPGPGARRGLNFVFGRDRKFSQPTPRFLEEMQELRDESIYFLEPHVREPVDMRMIENALCETSKYASVLQTGRAKRRYIAPA